MSEPPVVIAGAGPAGIRHGVNYVADAVDWCTILKTKTLWRVLFPADPEVPEAQLVAEGAVQARLQALAPAREPYHIEHRTLYRVYQRVADRFRCSS